MKVTFKNEFRILAGLGLALILLIIFSEQWPGPLLQFPRLVLGVLFLLFVPGYAFQAALFVRDDGPDILERLALSFGLSLAVVLLVTLVLEVLSAGIRLWAIVIGESIAIVAFSAICLLRRRGVPEEERFTISFEFTWGAWWSAQSRMDRLLLGVVALAMMTALVAVVATALLPKPGNLLTEFYVVGSTGQAERYPQQLALDQETSLSVGIINHEGTTVTYHAEARQDDTLIGELPPVQLDDGERLETLLTLAPVATGDDVRITLVLFREDVTDPYRVLDLWVSVVPSADVSSAVVLP